MHPVKIDEGEIALLKQAKAEKDWTILPTWKLKYLYQRCALMPMGDTTTVKEIGLEAKKIALLSKNFKGKML